MFIKGKDLVFYVLMGNRNVPVAHAKTCTITTTASVLPTTTYLSGNAETNDYTGKYAYTIKGDGVIYIGDVADGFSFQKFITSFTKVNWTFTDNNNVQWSGVCLVTSSSYDSSFDSVSMFQNELLGDGEYTFIENNVPPVPPLVSYVNIVDQFNTLVTSVQAPGTYGIIKFNAIDCGGANQPTPLIIFTA